MGILISFLLIIILIVLLKKSKTDNSNEYMTKIKERPNKGEVDPPLKTK